MVSRGRYDHGREYRIVKRFHEPEPLQRRLAELGWNAQVQTTKEFFIYGHATPPRSPDGAPAM